MTAFLDTSVLVATFLRDHQYHGASIALFVKAEKKSACCAAHTLAEVYSVLTRLPGKHRLSGEQAILFLEEIQERCNLVALTSEEYFSAIERAAQAGITGGALYDALLAHCALKAKAEAIYTWNVEDFQRLGPEVANRTRRP